MRKINKERPGGATETASPYSCTYSVRIKKFVGMVVSMFLIWVTVEEALAAFEDPTVSTTRTSQGQPAENRCRQKNYPGPENFEQGHIRNMTLTFYHEKRFEDGLKFVLSQTELGLTEEVREFYLALFYERLEKREEALEHCRRVCELDPAFFETREMEAQLNFDLKRYEVALERYTAIVELFPERETVYLGMAWLLMDMAKPLDALEMVNRALNKGLTGERLLALKRQLSRMIDGPVWPEGRKISDFKSNHYHVISDLGRRRCFEITKQLEEAFVSL